MIIDQFQFILKFFHFFNKNKSILKDWTKMKQRKKKKSMILIQKKTYNRKQ